MTDSSQTIVSPRTTWPDDVQTREAVGLMKTFGEFPAVGVPADM